MLAKSVLAGCMYNKGDTPALSSYVVGRSTRGQWQTLSVLDVCFRVEPFIPPIPPIPPTPPQPGCTCNGASDPQASDVAHTSCCTLTQRSW